MGIENWIAIGVFILSVIGTIITPILRRFRRHSVKLVDLQTVQNEMKNHIEKIEKNEDKMNGCLDTLKKEWEPKIESLHARINNKADISSMNNLYNQLSAKLETMNQNVIQILMLMRKEQ